MKINKYLPIVFFVILLDFQAIFNSNWDNVSERQIIFNKLDKLYHQQNFYAYYDSLQNFLLKVNPRISDDIKFKFAFSAYQNKDFKKAARLFNELKESGFLPSYSAYFEIRSIWGVDTSRALPLARD
ncbi:hypothetical protein, partial [Caldithrix abyssi]